MAFGRFAGVFAILAGAAWFLYAAAFFIVQSALLSALFLLLTGVTATPALVAVYGRLSRGDPSFALWAFVLSLAGALGASIHGGYDLANVLHPVPSAPPADLPSQVDPRGLLTFGLAGLALLVFAWLIGRYGGLPRPLGYFAYVPGVLLVLLYLARLVVVDATSLLVLGPAVLNGFLASPLWYCWLGVVLWRQAGREGPRE